MLKKLKFLGFYIHKKSDLSMRAIPKMKHKPTVKLGEFLKRSAQTPSEESINSEFLK